MQGDWEATENAGAGKTGVTGVVTGVTDAVKGALHLG